MARDPIPGKRRPIDGLEGYQTLEWWDRHQRLWLVTAQSPDDYQIGEGQWVNRNGLESARAHCADLARRYRDGYIDLGGNRTGKDEPRPDRANVGGATPGASSVLEDEVDQ